MSKDINISISNRELGCAMNGVPVVWATPNKQDWAL